MERRLILMRHAKSAWATISSSDHERPLTDQGRHDAPRVARRLVTLGWEPEGVLSSDAQRTRETWQGMAEELVNTPAPLFSSALYLAGLEELWTEAHSVDAELKTLLVLGHNPGWEMALFALCGEDTSMTTANAALLIGSGDDWPTALRGRWRLSEIIRPRELDAQ
jgi:phosphohistidine phosphatase